MDRRDVLKGVLGSVGVAHALPASGAEPEPPLAPDALAEELEQLRRDLDALQSAPDHGLGERWRQSGAGNRPVDVDEIAACHDQLVRSTMRTLAIAETVSSLPVANRQDDAVLELVAEHAAEMEYAFLGQASVVAHLGRSGERELRATLQQDPDVALDLGEHLDRIARGRRVAARRTRRLAGLVKHTTWRLQRQPVRAVVSDLELGTEKVGELAPEALRERMRPMVEERARVGHWAAEKRRLDRALSAVSDEPPADDPVGALDTADGDRLIRIAKTELTIGGILGGVGLVLILNGAALAGLSGGVAAVLIIAGLFPLTGFVVLMIVGLITLAVGHARRRRAKRPR